MQHGVTLLDAGKEIHVVIHPELGMETSLHQNSRSAQRQRFVNLFENRFQWLHVPFRRVHRTIESAKRAVFSAKISVIDVAINLIRNDVSGMEALADGVCFHADAQKILGTKHFQCLAVRQSHRVIPAFLLKMPPVVLMWVMVFSSHLPAAPLLDKGTEGWPAGQETSAPVKTAMIIFNPQTDTPIYPLALFAPSVAKHKSFSLSISPSSRAS